MNRKKAFFSRTAFLWLLLLPLTFGHAVESLADFPEKPITIIVPFGAGGAFDSLGRALGSRLEKDLGVPVVVKNEAGAGGRKGALTIYKSSPDGYTIGWTHFIPFISDEIFLDKKPAIDIRKFAVITKVADSDQLIYVSKKSKFKSLDDFKAAKRPIKFAGTGVGAITWVQAKAAGAAAGFDTTFVLGYKNLPQAAIAVARGDAEAGLGGYAHIKGVLNDIRPIVHMGAKRDPHLSDVPTIGEIGHPKLASLGTPRVLSAPPGTPENHVEVLRKALTKVMAEGDFLKWAEKNGFPINPAGPKELWQQIDNLTEIFQQIKPLLAKEGKQTN